MRFYLEGVELDTICASLLDNLLGEEEYKIQSSPFTCAA